MGLFSGKKKYVAYAASSPLFSEEDGLPDTLLGKLLTSNVTGSSKSGAVQTAIATDQFARVKSMMRYARKGEDPSKEGGYVRGVPTSNMSVITVDPLAVSEALERAVGAFDSISSTLSGTHDEGFFLSALTQAQWPEWDELQEEIALPSDGTIVPNDPEHVRVSGFDFGDEDPFGFQDRFTGEYIATWTSEDELTTYSLDLDLRPYLEKTYVMVKYLIGDFMHYWYYEIDSGLDPILEAAIDASDQSAEFLPVAILMQDRVWFDESDRDGTPAPDTELAITTNRLMKRFATSGTDIKEDFQEQEAEDDASGDKNKSNAKKWDFFIHFATSVDTNVRGAKEYLWEFYKDMGLFSTHTSDQYYEYLASESGGDRYTKAQPISELNITEGSENGYNVSYRWSFVETRAFAGDFLIDDPQADVTPRPLKPKEIHNEQYQRTDDGSQKPEYQSKLNDFFGEVVPTGLYDPNHKKNADNKDWERYGYHDYVIMTRALEDGTGYEQTLIMGLSMQYKINTKDTDTGAKGYRYRYATPHMFGTDEETREFRIAMQWGSLKKVPVLHREEAVSEAMAGTVFLVEVIKIAWYQTGFFKWLLIIIAIVLLVISIWFPFLIQGAIAAFGAAMGGGALALFVAYVVIQFAVGFMIALGTSLMSPEMQMILAVVIIVAMLYTGQFQNIGNSLKSFQSAPGWGSAAALINAVGPVYNMGFSVYNQYTIGQYEDEFRDLLKDQSERQQELEDAWDAFGPVPAGIDPLELQKAFQRQGATEMPSEYYERVLQANPGILGYDLIANWAGNAYMLPKSSGPTMIEGMIQDFEKQRG